ncbi:hypothetical protein CDAR_30881 [Caerostris darwini]|uniref:Uncharacterized protein n=1 Tax=Caerostris darwini TaxID=1538125 RepID=A0AAV4NRS9_9ARAC|nr:hypothetical protein CDAR_30881 [Caerostris darwini]
MNSINDNNKVSESFVKVSLFEKSFDCATCKPLFTSAFSSLGEKGFEGCSNPEKRTSLWFVCSHRQRWVSECEADAKNIEHNPLLTSLAS